MSLFTKAEVTSAYLKMGIMGFAGSGKTYTGTLTAIGLVELMRQNKSSQARKPIFFLDTEGGSDWVKPKIEAAGIELFTAKTRAFRDLLEAVPEAEANASLLMVDSLTHFWVELTDAYMRAKKRTRLQFEDWAFLKTEWRKFTDLFVNSSLHVIVCGRAGFEYDYSTDEETGKKNLEKTGIKMKAEGEMGYEPSLLVLMERELNMVTKVNSHIAKVMKDRSTQIDGKEFVVPTFESFLPHIQCLNLGGRQLSVDTTRTSVSVIPADIRDTRRRNVTIVLEKIEALLNFFHPSSSGADKKAKISLCEKHLGTTSWTAIQDMSLEALRQGFDKMHVELKGEPSQYGQPERIAINDELPGDLAPPKPANDGLELPGFLDRRAKPNGAQATEPNWTELYMAG
jgi:hypothetical protein